MSAKDVRAGSEANAQDMMNIFCFALGSGAQMRIKRDAMRLFREAFYPSIEHVSQRDDWKAVWEREAAQALEYVRIIGKLAAQIAAGEGKSHIDTKDMAAAIRKVLGQVKKILPLMGPMCQLVPEDYLR